MKHWLRIMNNPKKFRWFWGRIIRDSQSYMRRYGLRTPWFCVFLHRYYGPDSATPHNHPFKWTWSVVIKGTVIEHETLKHGYYQCVRTPFYKQDFYPKVRCMNEKTFHRIDYVEPGSWTLFVAGPRTQEWRFEDNKVRD